MAVETTKLTKKPKRQAIAANSATTQWMEQVECISHCFFECFALFVVQTAFSKLNSQGKTAPPLPTFNPVKSIQYMQHLYKETHEHKFKNPSPLKSPKIGAEMVQKWCSFIKAEAEVPP